jgi:hypothetical protein
LPTSPKEHIIHATQDCVAKSQEKTKQKTRKCDPIKRKVVYVMNETKAGRVDAEVGPG